MKLQVAAAIFASASLLTLNTAFSSDCDAKYTSMIENLETHLVITDDMKKMVKPVLEEALMLCKSGQTDAAAKVVKDFQSDAMRKRLMEQIQAGN